MARPACPRCSYIASVTLDRAVQEGVRENRYLTLKYAVCDACGMLWHATYTQDKDGTTSREIRSKKPEDIR